jgi:hypothetical protein
MLGLLLSFLAISAVPPASKLPLLAVVDAAIAATKTPCNADGHAINITNVASESVELLLVGTYQNGSSLSGSANVTLAPSARHTLLACTSYGGYVLHVGGSMWNDHVHIHAQTGLSTDDLHVDIPQMHSWDPIIVRE